MTRRLAVLALALAPLAAVPASANVVLDWNTVLLDAVRADKTSPPKASRAMAAMHVAMFDAIVGIEGGYEPATVTVPGPAAGASADAAAACAAHDVLAVLFPGQKAAIDAAFEASLAGIPDGPAEGEGLAWGQRVGATVLAHCAADHSDATVPYEPPQGAGWWTKTPPAYADPLLPQWPYVTPWALPSPSALRPTGPRTMRSAEYTRAFDEVRRLGRTDSRFRTADQTEIALFWADGPGTATPPGHWLVIADEVARDRGLTTLETARLFALLGMTVADAAIAAWDSKYAYDDWRPLTAIAGADHDGNPATTADPGWTPFIATPPFPSYVSGHSTFSAGAARLLGLYLGTDAWPFETTSDGLPGVQRSFAGFRAAAEEAGQSRIYGGIHWQYDNQDGLALGRAVAERVWATRLLPSSGPGTCVPNLTTTTCLGGRYEVRASWASAGVGGAPAFVGDVGAASAQFWFFDPENPELFVKILDGCALNGHAWVFVSGLTDLGVELTVTDTASGRTRRYLGAGGRPFAAIDDTSAFACE